jgi:hypothetical protein
MGTRDGGGCGLSRRDFLAGGCAAGAGLLLGGAGCAGPTRAFLDADYARLPPRGDGGRALLGIYRGVSLAQACDDLIPRLGDLAWLKPGNSVLIKVACNSPNPHPAVTAPAAVGAVVEFLKRRGAGQVIVADQAGVEHVRLTASRRVSATRAAMAKNGLLAAAERAGARVDCFDEHGWDGYFQARADFGGHWGAGPWLPKILERVDHVVNLPRLSTHALAGYTCGLKSAVGWLRDDSRLLLHQKAARFYERVAEINHFQPLRDKLRFTLTLADRALLKIGPDFGGHYKFDGWLALGARSLVDHDAVAAALLPWLDRNTVSFYDLFSPYPRRVDYFNRKLVRETWGQAALGGYESLVAPLLGGRIEADPALSHLARLQGYRPAAIAVDRVGEGLPTALVAHLRGVGDGLFRL